MIEPIPFPKLGCEGICDCPSFEAFCESVFGCFFFVVQQFIEADHDLLARIIWPPELLGRVLTGVLCPRIDNGMFIASCNGDGQDGRMQTGYYDGFQSSCWRVKKSLLPVEP